LPFAGHPVGVPKAADAKADIDKLHSAYRFLLADLFPFGRNARIQLEHGGTNESTEHYDTVTYWYGLPAPSPLVTDERKIADARRAPTDADFKPAGAWYLAGSNTCVFSRPKGELDPAEHIIETSNRRFRDDEFLVPRELTAGRRAVRVRVKFTPVERPLFPG